MNVILALHARALRHPNRVALIDPAMSRKGQSLSRHRGFRATYGALDRGAREAAAAIVSSGIPAGGRVALIAESSSAFVRAWLGIAYAGCSVVPVPILSAVPEIVLRVGHAGCDAIVADDDRRAAASRAVDQLGRAVHVLGLDDLRGELPIATPVAPPDDEAMILYTSGTTGSPRGAVITHASLHAHTRALVDDVLRLDEADCILGVLPLTHSYGIRMVVLTALLAGARAVIVPRFDARETLELLAREAVTFLPVVPTMLSTLAAGGDGGSPSHFPALRWCLSAGAPLADDVRARAEARLGVEIRQAYGLTEATISTVDAPPAPRVLGSVGRPVPGVEVRVVDASGNDAPWGTEGEVVVRGQNVMRAYVDDAEATADAMRGGYLHTGDVGRLDENGVLTVVDRTKDVIIRGGVNVYPSEVEDVLARHPSVLSVAVVGRPDPHWGEEIVAVIVTRPGSDVDPGALDAFAREHIAKNKVPRELAVVDELPLGPSRKVQRRELRAQLAAGTLRAVPVRPR